MPTSSQAPEPLRFDTPLCVNVIRLQDYLLPPDELIFFDWIVVKQIHVFHFRPFHYSQQRIGRETRIARRRLSTIVEKFSEKCWISSQVRWKHDKTGRVRHYAVDFAKILEDLDQIIAAETALYAAFVDFLSDVIRRLADIRHTGSDAAAPHAPAEAEALIGELQEIHDRRVDLYNAGRLTDAPPPRKLPTSKIVFDHAHKLLLCRAMARYDEETLAEAFLAYTDRVITGNLRASSFAGLFLTHDKNTGEFPVVQHHAGFFRRFYKR